MYKKAFAYDEDVVFYFDDYDNKYVAKGGSLAWRTNNPGLVHSHSTFKQESIGSYGQIAIFPSQLQGENALYEWLNLKKNFYSPLISIAEQYDSDSPEKFLKKLCNLTSLREDITPSSLSKTEMCSLVFVIKQLLDFPSTGNKEFQLLPKITARFYSETANSESYLIGSDTFLSKSEAIDWVETHRLDAVIVSKNDNTTYLRSRPGHHLQKIHFGPKDSQGLLEFEDVVRDCGVEKINQCIWAFINGISNSKKTSKESASKISEYTGGELVWSLINDTKIWPIGDIVESILFKIDIRSKVIQLAVKFFKFLIQQSNKNPNHPPVIVMAHSQGAMICEFALKELSTAERQRLRIFTFGGWTFIPQELCHKDSHNYFSPYDLVAKGGSPNIGLFLLQLHEGEKKGLKQKEIIDQLIMKDQDFYLDSTHPIVVEKFRTERLKFYLELLKKASNVTLLQDSIEGPFEHSFNQNCYQKTVKDLIHTYKR